MPTPEPTGAPAAGSRHPLVERILGGGVADALRLSAARGALPIPAQDMVFLQVRLTQDRSPPVAESAAKSLAELPIESLQPVLKDNHCDSQVLDYFVHSGRLTGEDLAIAIAHAEISDATLESIAASGSNEALSLIVTNEVRIIANPQLVTHLRSNQNLSQANRRRLNELERDFIGKERFEIRSAAEPTVEAPPPLPEGMPPAGEELVEEAPEEPPPLFKSPDEARAFEEALAKTPAFQRIMKLGVGERVALAMKGNKEERAILIRDTARLVSLQVLKSPKLSENEVANFAAMRNVHEDVLRVIARGRDWTKSYSVIHTLVRNPKTPPGLSTQFLARLGTRDLKLVTHDKGIPELLRRRAKNLFAARTQPKKRMGGRKH